VFGFVTCTYLLYPCIDKAVNSQNWLASCALLRRMYLLPGFLDLERQTELFAPTLIVGSFH